MSTHTAAELGILAKLVLVLALLLLLSGIFMYGAHQEALQRLWTDLIERPRGQMAFRFVLQPAMAAIAAFHDGMKDARVGHAPYFWSLLHQPEVRTVRLREALNATARIVLLGLGMDAIYQWKAFGTFYPIEALDIALLLALIPYLLLRGTIARIAARFLRDRRRPG